MNVGLADFVRMARTLAAPTGGDAVQDAEERAADKPLTIRILAELAHSRGTSSEIAAILGLSVSIVAGTLSNMRRQNWVKAVAELSSRTAPARLYAITNAGIRRLNQWEMQ